MSVIKKYWLPILIGTAGVYYIIRSLKKPESVLQTDGSVVTGTSGKVTSGAAKSGFPLKRGDNNDLVGQLQAAIGVQNLPKYGIDHDFGSETEAAVIKFLGKSTVDSQADIDAIAQASTYSTSIPNPTISRGSLNGGIVDMSTLTSKLF